ncbi:ligand-binding protein SH3 [Actinophytocola xinjiangensis]|uniref:Ligand-binding protein SH3 n=1 Tax=Actinophytocola xinjiangensis TaxID=485602 RepID=A0A7Z1B0C6_9PSEU|nr:multidrug efflux SMR transporter [Actinophytocola xinjiangensis]OLF14484.1 ligand-binding protein SH3 [Actinophytocola xinjiangensis]
MPYLFLACAILFEVVATSLLKTTDGFSRLWPTVLVLALYAGSFAWLSLAVRQVPVGVAYAMWAGLGTALIVAIGVVFLGESIDLAKVLGVLLIIGGVVTLNLGGAAQ